MEPDKEVTKIQNWMFKGYLAVAKLSLSLTVKFFKKRGPQRIRNGVVSLSSKVKKGVQQLNQWRKNRQATKQMDKKSLVVKSSAKQQGFLTKDPSQSMGYLNRSLMKAITSFLRMVPRRMQNALFRNNTMTRDSGTRELGRAIQGTVAKPARTEKLELNNSTKKPLSTLTKHARSTSYSINAGLAAQKPLTRAQNLPNIKVGR